MSNRARAAIWYTKVKGWYVVPLHLPLFDEGGNCVGCTCEEWKRRKYPDFICLTPGKHPRLTDWEAKAANDPREVEYWWRRFPNANVGIAAGRSGLLTFDIDLYKDAYQGNALLSREDEQTVTNLTGSGGQHLIYAMPSGATFGNSKGTLPPGIDIRGFGGQFVAPPSIHPSGDIYRWEIGYGPHEIDVLPLPQAVATILEEHQNQLQEIEVHFGELPEEQPDLEQWSLTERIVRLINDPPEAGQRSEADQSVITALVAAGATDDEIHAVFGSYPIGLHGKFREKGGHALHYLGHSIARARAYVEHKHKEEIEQRTDAFLTATLM